MLCRVNIVAIGVFVCSLTIELSLIIPHRDVISNIILCLLKNGSALVEK